MGNLPSISELQNAENVNLADLNLTCLPFTPLADSKTKYLFLSGNNITQLPENMKNVSIVDLSNNEMGASFPPLVSKALSSYDNLQKLELNKNLLENLNDFENRNIESLNLLQNRFHELPENFFDKFPNLKTVFFDCNFLETLQNQSSSSITKLTLSLNCIETIASSTLYFSKLTFLNLSKNQIKKLPNDFSKSFPALQDLNLSDNFISEIPDNDDENFVFPKTLKVLDLSNNLLEKIPNSITCLPNLTNLNVENNNITYIPKMGISLKKFKASDNKITKILEQELPSLKEIDLSNNKFTEFPTELKVPKITSYSISHNQIREINFDYSKVLSSKITTFDISFNQIEVIPKDFFQSLPNLHNLHVYFNKITEIPAEISNCKSLFTLNISNNPLKKLPMLPISLDRIYASNCNIDSFEDIFDVSQTKSIFLSHADLSCNNLESFPAIPSIQNLNLSQNRIKKLPQITENLRTLDVSMNRIESISEKISGESICELNLSHNKLTEVPQFSKVPLLMNLELNGNAMHGDLDLSCFKFLKRIDISETEVSLVGEAEKLKEIIDSKEDSKSPIMKRPVYLQLNGEKSGYSEIMGLRNKMEDSMIMRDDLNLYAICDGHGGPDTSKFVSIRIAELFEEKVKSDKYNYDIAKNIVSDVVNQAGKELESMNLEDGSTLCLASICKNGNGKNKIITANIGDSRALIVRADGKSREMTKDHKPFMRSEFERVHNEYGRLSNENRVDGILAVARSMGDFRVHGVGKKADLLEFDLDDNDKYLIIGCDGVFDVLSNDDVARVAMNASSTTEAACMIRNAASASLSSDNISVIVVDLSKHVPN